MKHGMRWGPTVAAYLGVSDILNGHSPLLKNPDDLEIKIWKAARYQHSIASICGWTLELFNTLLQASCDIPLDLPITSMLPEHLRRPKTSHFWYFDCPTKLFALSPNGTEVEMPDTLLIGIGQKYVQVSGYFVKQKPYSASFDLSLSLADTVKTWNTALLNGTLSPEEVTVLLRLCTIAVAGLLWIDQRIVRTELEEISTKRSAAVKSLTHRDLQAVKIVHLRRYESRTDTLSDDVPTTVTDRHLTCRFLVKGHWRNQAFGTKHQDRKLMFILPYVKGPEDKPFKDTQTVIAIANR